MIFSCTIRRKYIWRSSSQSIGRKLIWRSSSCCIWRQCICRRFLHICTKMNCIFPTVFPWFPLKLIQMQWWLMWWISSMKISSTWRQFIRTICWPWCTPRTQLVFFTTNFHLIPMFSNSLIGFWCLWYVWQKWCTPQTWCITQRIDICSNNCIVCIAIKKLPLYVPSVPAIKKYYPPFPISCHSSPSPNNKNSIPMIALHTRSVSLCNPNTPPGPHLGVLRHFSE